MNAWTRGPYAVALQMSCLVVLVLLLPACSTPKGRFESKRDPAYSQKLQRLLVVHFVEGRGSFMGQRFSDDLGNRVVQMLTEKGVPSELVRVDRAELDLNTPVRDAGQRFRPRQLLYMGVSSINQSRSVHYTWPGDLPHFATDTSLGLEFNLVDVPTGKAVWRGRLTFHSVPRAEDVVAQLQEELAANAFF
jgi:hypothetical protein